MRSFEADWALCLKAHGNAKYITKHDDSGALDADGDGGVPITELVRGFMRMRGNAKAKDLLAVRALIYRCHHEIQSELKCHAAELKQLSRIEANQHTFVTEFTRQLRPQTHGSRNIKEI